jgi:hypothetical protein
MLRFSSQEALATVLAQIAPTAEAGNAAVDLLVQAK